MLVLNVSKKELYDDYKNEFINIDSYVITLEHSLLSVSKWESIYEKPFLNDQELTAEEQIEYIKCMSITQNVPDIVYKTLSKSEIGQVSKYIEDKKTATFFNNRSQGNNVRNTKIVTSELIYSWMVKYQIPFECQKWHLNRLLTLIEICKLDNEDPKSKRMSKNEIYEYNKALNKARRAKYNSKG